MCAELAFTFVMAPSRRHTFNVIEVSGKHNRRGGRGEQGERGERGEQGEGGLSSVT